MMAAQLCTSYKLKQIRSSLKVSLLLRRFVTAIDFSNIFNKVNIILDANSTVSYEPDDRKVRENKIVE